MGKKGDNGSYNRASLTLPLQYPPSSWFLHQSYWITPLTYHHLLQEHTEAETFNVGHITSSHGIYKDLVGSIFFSTPESPLRGMFLIPTCSDRPKEFHSARLRIFDCQYHLPPRSGTYRSVNTIFFPMLTRRTPPVQMPQPKFTMIQNELNSTGVL